MKDKKISYNGNKYRRLNKKWLLYFKPLNHWVPVIEESLILKLNSIADETK